MLDHIILTVSSVERSLAFYEAAHPPTGSDPETGFSELWAGSRTAALPPSRLLARNNFRLARDSPSGNPHSI